MASDNSQFEVVVIGGGLAGHRAALAAAAAGARVALIEKQPVPGGSTVLSGGSFAFAGTDMQQARGIVDSEALLRQDLTDAGGGLASAELIDVYIAHQLAEYEYLRTRGAAFTHVQASAGHSVPRSHRSDPRRVLELLHAEAEASRAISFLPSTAASRLARSEPTSRVDTVLVGSDGGTARKLHAGRGIVIASGGFSRSQGLLDLFVPQVRGALPGGGIGNVGDGLRLAWEHGAMLADIGQIKGTFGAYYRPDPGESPSPSFPIYKGAIAVNLQGERFADESRSYKTLGEACLRQTNGLAFQIFDQSIMDESIAEVPSYNFEKLLARRRVMEAGTLEDLAGILGLWAERLSDTVAAYNRDAGNGRDTRFGRRTLTHNFGTIRPIATPPFYGFPCTTVLSATYAGLQIDRQARAIDVWGDPIPGLYAAGEVTGGFHGGDYMTGSALVKALVFGKVAAESALAAN